MKSFLPVDTRQMKDMIHFVTSNRDGQTGSKKFIIVRSYTDMRGFRLGVRQIIRHGDERQVVAEIIGEERVVIDSIFIPEDRRGLYSNETQALKFASGRIIRDDSPYDKIVQEARLKVMSDFKIKTEAQGLEKFEEETAVNKRLHYDATVKKLLDMK